MRVVHCTRAVLVPLTAVTLLVGGGSRASAQPARESTFTIYIRSTPVGTERVSVERSADGFTIASTGRIGPPVDVVVRQFKARYDGSWKPVELSIEVTIRGVESTLHTTVSGTTATSEASGGPGNLTRLARRVDETPEARVIMKRRPGRIDPQ